MKIRRVLLQNYKALERLEFHLHPRLTVFVGENGGGKTSVVHALRLLLWSYVRNFKESVRQGVTPRISHSDVHRHFNNDAKETEAKYPSFVKGEIFSPEDGRFDLFDPEESLDDEYIYFDGISCELKSPNSNNEWNKGSWSDGMALSKMLDAISEDLDRFQGNNSDSVQLYAIACYGTNRLWKKDVKFKDIERDLSRLSGYDGATSFESNFLRFEWFISFLFSSAKNGYIDKNNIVDLWDAVRDAIYSVTGWQQSLPKKGETTILFSKPDTPKLMLSQMGDGVRGMIELVGDLACRCALLNPYYGKDAVKKTSGVVLIDEVDLHLHPRWQQKILVQLQEAFPNIQFIVTTHSPQVLTTVPAECIRVLRTELDQETGQSRVVINSVIQQTEGVGSADVLAAVMDIDPVPNIGPAKKLSEYMALIQQNLEGTVEGLEMRMELDSHFGVDHPLMHECNRLIRLQALKKKFPAVRLRENKE